MEQKALRKILWEEAGKAGLALGAVSSAYLFLAQFAGTVKMPALLSMLVTTILWAGKFGGCIWLMMYFMKKFAKQVPDIQNRTSYRFGLAASVLSALVYAAASFANTAFISADMIAENTKLLMDQMAPVMDSNSLNQMEDMMAKLPQITFFSNLFYCIIYGSILSFILSRNIPNKNPFAEDKSAEW